MLTARFTPASMNAEQYHEVHRRLTEAGAGQPDGRVFHVCSGTGDRLCVVDVWESAEQFAAFGQKLMPILAEVGVDPGVPDMQPVLLALDPLRAIPA